MASSDQFARRQRERARKQQSEEKRVKRQERREQKKLSGGGLPVDPMNDPTIDWANAVRQTPIPDPTPDEESGEGQETED